MSVGIPPTLGMNWQAKWYNSIAGENGPVYHGTVLVSWCLFWAQSTTKDYTKTDHATVKSANKL